MKRNLDDIGDYANRLKGFVQSRLPTRFNQRLDPMDIVQSALASFLKRQQKIGTPLNQENDLWCLLAAITHRKLLKKIRYHLQLKRNVNAESTWSDTFNHETTSDTPTPVALSILNESLNRLEESLPTTHQKVLQLKMSGFSIDEIASQLNLSQRTVNRGLQLIRSKARKLLNET